MKIGDKVKVKDCDGIFEIVWVYTESVKPFYALARNRGTYLLETLKTKHDLELVSDKEDVRHKIQDIYYKYHSQHVACALGEMLLQRIPPDEVMDMLNNIDEYIK